MNYILQTGAVLLIAAITFSPLPADARDDKQEANKADPPKKQVQDDKEVKKDTKDGKDEKKDDAKQDDKDAKKEVAKDAKKDAAKKDAKDDKDPKNDAAKKDAAKKKDEHVNTGKMIKAGEVTGKIVAVEVSRRSVRLAVNISVPKNDSPAAIGAATTQAAAVQNILLARNAFMQYQSLLVQAQQSVAQAQQAISKKDKNGFNQNMNQANQFQAQAIQFQLQAAQYRAMAGQQAAVSNQAASQNDTVHKEIVIGTTEDVQVRLAKPAEVYDDKGKPRRLTAKELKEAKGDDPKLPGYQADFANLREEQIVTMTLVKNKDKPKLKPAGKNDKDADDLLGDNQPKASRIMIIAEPPASK
jgi:hypothetical protein